ncbi:hypothetical protein [Flavobacterium sp. ASV13]|uniref:hypothetical protein n=1 Tax=Flavobacterium sp. ASV13 TaxID=1506583 RepID=UPI001267FFC4|nr:hypothetical protein [Flavobacterium sp. ASV13]
MQKHKNGKAICHLQRLPFAKNYYSQSCNESKQQSRKFSKGEYRHTENSYYSNTPIFKPAKQVKCVTINI